MAFLLCSLAGCFLVKKEESCRSLVDGIIKKPWALATKEKADHTKDACYEIIVRTGDYKELYAYYEFYKFVDDVLSSTTKKDMVSNNIYYWMLFYANQNSREFDSKTKEFKKEQGLYEQELKEFEEQMTQEEKIKSFFYVADNLATGKEGWVLKNDYQKSFEYLKRAAEVGDYSSQGALGVRYFLGTDRYNKFQIEKNYIEGYKWIFISTQHSKQDIYYYNTSSEAFKILKKKITQVQLKEAKQQANIWLEQNKEFIKNHPLELIKMTDEEIKSEREKTEKFIKDNQLDQPLPANNQ